MSLLADVLLEIMIDHPRINDRNAARAARSIRAASAEKESIQKGIQGV